MKGKGMKALTLTQPWASLIALGHKHVETRSWTTYQHYGGVIAIHAAKGFPRYAREFFAEERLAGRVPPLIPFSAIVAVARLADCCRTEQVGITDGVVRFSVGIEDVTDLMADIDQALGAK